MDACSFLNEGINVCPSSNAREWDSVEQMPLDGKTISEWMSELDAIAKEVEAELVSRDIGCHLVEVLQAVNLVLFELRGFKRSPVLVDSKHSYLHLVLSSGCGSAILLSIIYIEVCRRLGLTIVGSRVGEDFLIWPQTTYPEELFKVTSGHSLFTVVNGRCVKDPRSMASDLTGSSLLGLEIASNRDIVGIALANLIRFHWKRASRSNLGLMLTSPLRHAHNANEKPNQINKPNVPLLRPQDLKLAIMASERLLILQPHNWALRRDHGMMLYYNKRGTQSNYKLKWPCMEPLGYPNPTSYYLLGAELIVGVKPTREYILKLAMLQPHNQKFDLWRLLLLDEVSEYGKAVQELSICMAFAPEEEAELLEPFVEKLQESSWKSLGDTASVTVK
ncbi:hypothetical protein GOBAR_AA26085 [Gossypium barbadense]|uniref:Protein SirB1 N-terminal domain-containing protein n=1 Tax=Gossypium barbadense TaxID=3634 RepID=A0A2P5WU38_GOSBA|nr:hypothetical protein GOBAR_AA26085 [Gossypium barbadense]